MAEGANQRKRDANTQERPQGIRLVPALLIGVIDHRPSRDGLVSASSSGGSLSWAISDAESALVHHVFYQMVHQMFTR